ncbi:MAG: hypothetical protein IK038_13405 [Bacteroidaceae bacterium]|nr:hypothetical protein [Bacteroidaceae bacterium]
MYSSVTDGPFRSRQTGYLHSGTLSVFHSKFRHPLQRTPSHPFHARRASRFKTACSSALGNKAHRARPAYILRIRSRVRRSGNLRGNAYAPTQTTSA